MVISGITEKHINDFLKKYHPCLSVKMFRTWTANQILLKELLQLPIHKPPQNQKGMLYNLSRKPRLLCITRVMFLKKLYE